MYLTKMELSLSAPVVRAALTDAQKMHRLVSGFFQMARKDAEVLYCCRNRERYVDLYMYSAVPIDENRLLPGLRLVGQKDVTVWLESMEQGDALQFRIVTVPFRKVTDLGCKNSRRRALRSQEERLSWLARKAEQGGFRLLSVQETPYENLTARHGSEEGGVLTVDAYCYSGVLQITDAVKFRQTIRSGIGAEKAYGLGMLMLIGR